MATNLMVNSGDTILAIKAMIQDKESFPPDEQCLICMDKHLENGCTLQDYNITQDSVVSHVPRLRMGTGLAKSGCVEQLATVAAERLSSQSDLMSNCRMRSSSCS